MTPIVESDRIDVQEIADRLKISPYSVRELLKAGVIPGIKFGRRNWLVNRAVFEEWWAGAGKK